jgi:hypothetical protein
MLDHVMGGEGLWTYWRKWKPATFDAVVDGWAPLRWCLLADHLHTYSGRAISLEAVLANEGVLPPGQYPARFRIFGPSGTVWEKATTVRIPDSSPLAIPVLSEIVELAGPAGRYTFAANLERGGAPSGGRLLIHLADEAELPELNGHVAVWGIHRSVQDWLAAHGLRCEPFDGPRAEQTRLVLVGEPAETEALSAEWRRLTDLVAEGKTAVFLSPRAFRRGDDSTYWLPLDRRGRCFTFGDWLYHKECVAKRHPVFAGLQSPGIMDWDYYGPVIPHELFEGQETPEETIAAAFTTGHPLYSASYGYGTGLLIAAYRLGRGRLLVSTPYILENVGEHPAADRLLVNLIRYAQA